jgi:hypothetical protein
MPRVQREDFLLVVGSFDAHGKQCFADLGRQITPLTASREARELHGQRAATTHDAAGAEVEAHGPCDREGIHARVAFEPLVLEHQQGTPEFPRHRVPRWKAPLSVAGDARAEQRAVACFE